MNTFKGMTYWVKEDTLKDAYQYLVYVPAIQHKKLIENLCFSHGFRRYNYEPYGEGYCEDINYGKTITYKQFKQTID